MPVTEDFNFNDITSGAKVWHERYFIASYWRFDLGGKHDFDGSKCLRRLRSNDTEKEFNRQKGKS